MREAEIVAVVAGGVDAGFARAVWSAGVSAPGYRASEIFANRDEFHLGRGDSLARIPKLGDRMIGGCAQWFAARGRAGSSECWAFRSDSRVLVRQIAIINWPNDSSFDFVHISALQDPIAAQGRKPLYWIKRHAWVAPWAARVVHAYRLIDFDFTVYGLGRCKRYLAKWYTN